MGEELLLDHCRRVGESCVRVADLCFHLECQVVAPAFFDQRGPGLEGQVGVHEHGQRLVVDLDQLQCVLGDVAVVRHHHCHRLADEVHRALGEHRVRQLPHQRIQRLDEALRDTQFGLVDHRLQRGGVGRGENGVHTGHRAGGGDVDPGDARVRLRAAQKRCLQGSGHPDVVDKPALAAQQAIVLDPRDGAAEPAGVGLLRSPHCASRVPKRSSSACSAAARILR